MREYKNIVILRRLGRSINLDLLVIQWANIDMLY